MTFNIAFTDDDAEDGCAAGKIELADIRETIEADLSIWSVEEYQAHWQETALAATVEDGVVFLTSRPRTGYADAWSLSRRDEQFVCRNSLIRVSDLAFEGARVRRKRQGVSLGDDANVSQWFIPVGDVEAFAARAVAPARRLS